MIKLNTEARKSNSMWVIVQSKIEYTLGAVLRTLVLKHDNIIIFLASIILNL
jgi:hypothetical protein